MMYKIVKMLARITLYPIFLPRITGRENIPQDGGYIISANHSSNFDPIFTTLPQKRKVYFLAKFELFKFKPFAVFISWLGARPLHRDASDLHAVKNALTILRGGNPLTIYPQGTRHNPLDMEHVKTGVAVLAVKGKVPVLPIGIGGRYLPFSRVKINIGKPIYFDDDYDRKLSADDFYTLTKQVVNEIIALREK